MDMKKILLLFALLFAFINNVKAQFVQNFDSGTTTPAGWTVINGGDPNTWTFGVPSSGTTFSGSNVAKIIYNSTVAHNDYLITPQITVMAGINDRITFRVRNRDVAFVEHFDVKLSTTTGSSAANFTTTILPDTAAPSVWTKMTINLTPYVGQSIYIGFHAISLNKYELYLDDIVSGIAPVCNYSAPVAVVTQPTCTATGSVILSGLPSTGIWTLYTSRLTLSIPQSTTNTTTTGTGTSTTVTVAQDDFSSRFYSYYFIDENGCQSPTKTITISSKYYFSESLQCAYQDSNNDGVTNVGDQIICHIIVGSGTSCDIGNGQFTLGSGDGFNQFATLGILNFPGNSTQIFDIPYNITQQDISNGYATCSLQVSPQGVGYGFSNSILPVTTSLNTNGIRLNAFIDSNNNGTKESSEPLFAFGDFHYTKNGGIPFVINSSNGSYLIPEWISTNSYNISFTVNPLFSNYLNSTATYSGVTSAAGIGINDYYFPVTYINSNGDLQVNIIPTGASPRPGFAYKNRIAYLNSFNYPVSGTLTFTKDNAVTINSVSQSGVVNNAAGFNYNFNLPSFGTGYIDVAMQVNPAAVLGSTLTNASTITIPVNDTYPQNNNSSVTQTIINSYDPNNKTETHGGEILYPTFSANDYLTYTINFENTGTANAINVDVTDNLDYTLNENSIIMVSSSHNYILEKSGAFLKWKFNGINLVPSGKGFITFKIKPKPGYAPGNIIFNTANIYFDFNSAIVTNMCTTEFVTSLKNINFAFSELKYFPNPVKNSLFISNSSIITQVEISSVLGQKMMTLNSNEFQTEIDLSNFPNGVLFIKVTAEGEEKTFKIIKE